MTVFKGQRAKSVVKKFAALRKDESFVPRTHIGYLNILSYFQPQENQHCLSGSADIHIYVLLHFSSPYIHACPSRKKVKKK